MLTHKQAFAFPFTVKTVQDAAAFKTPRRRPSQKFEMCMETRRDFLLRTPSIAIPLILSSSGNIHAGLSELVSRIPGAAMPDVYYPPFFLGEWLVTRNLCSVDAHNFVEILGHTVLSSEGLKKLRMQVGQLETFDARFIEHRGHVIEDRKFNAKGEYSHVTGSSRMEVIWQKDSPGVMSMSWGDASERTIREINVAKRSFKDGEQGYGAFVSSEYARVADVLGDGAMLGFGRPPSIFARRRLAQYRVSSVTNLMIPDGLQRVVVDYVYPPGAPVAKPAIMLKYRDVLSRKHS